MKSISNDDLRPLREQTRELLAKKFSGRDLLARVGVWSVLCRTLFYRHDRMTLLDAAKQAYQTAKGMKLGAQTLTKLRIAELEAIRAMQARPLPKKSGRRLSRLQYSLMKTRRM